MKINVSGGTMEQAEIDAYVKYLEEKYPEEKLASLDLKIDGEDVDMHYTFETVPFERIRRITGYLVGTVDRFNDAKKSEVKDRVKHFDMDSCPCAKC